ncbi:2-oxo acid dehydrogenase subunit E2 [Arachnia propionica]|uniref:Dihydrolipoamide acetyltransferase component of pyruvate dehydrogenase complex n=1 Tax=Arachnia propionica TaxID=1750 RepID=A0A3P1TAK6_9ACTN|nr:dihydrolipoamide acetyltransferase family protein [Arachnia propionica]RRD06350.1 2-oxo acid dehydrogenase subunit E2 [Arachnia propionica]
MATVIVMPALGNSVESCLIVSWAVKEGDTIAENSVLCEVETDKAAMEVPATAAGTVLKRLWEEGDDVPVMQPLLVVGEPGEDPAPALAEAGFGDAAPTPAPEEAPAETPAAEPTPAAAIPAAPVGDAPGASPRARNLAAAEGIDLASVPAGTGPEGRIIARDVAAVADGTTKAAARAGATAGEGTGLGGRVSQADLAGSATDAAPAAPTSEAAKPAVVSTETDFPGPSTQTPLKGIRKVISERMMHSLASSAQLTYTATARAQGLLDLRKRLKASDPALGLTKVTIGDLVGFAAVKTAAKHPSHNAHLEDGVLTTFERVHLGFACDTPRGLLVPTVRDASRMTLGQFSAVSKELAAQAIEGNINPDLLSGATFTVSNLGGFGIESFTPLLNVPQTAILGVDAIVPRAWVNEKGKTKVEQRIGLSLTADHRVIDGADAARFLADLVAFIENIEFTVML